MYNRRSKRMSEAIKKEISNIILHEIRDPRISFVTVTRIDLASDLRKAKVFVSILGDKTTQETSIYGLQKAKSFIQGQVAQRLNFRYTPILSFHIDDSLKKIAHINSLIEGLNPKTEDGNDDNDDTE